MKSRHPKDGRWHFSELREMAHSPAHCLQACADAGRPPTRPMIVGTITDCLVFGQKGFAVYSGKVRNGKEWDTFRAQHAGKVICNRAEFEDAEGAALSVIEDPVARHLIIAPDAVYQQCIQWQGFGFPCAAGIPGERGGIDLTCTLTADAVEALGFGKPGDFVEADLKLTASTEPETFAKHAWRMLWHAQRAFYGDYFSSIGRRVDHHLLIGVEPYPPHVPTVLRVDEEAIDAGRRSCALWAERVRECEKTGHWPGYVQRAAEMLVPEWAQ